MKKKCRRHAVFHKMCPTWLRLLMFRFPAILRGWSEKFNGLTLWEQKSYSRVLYVFSRGSFKRPNCHNSNVLVTATRTTRPHANRANRNGWLWSSLNWFPKVIPNCLWIRITLEVLASPPKILYCISGFVLSTVLGIQARKSDIDLQANQNKLALESTSKVSC